MNGVSYKIARDTSKWTTEADTRPSHKYPEGKNIIQEFKAYTFETGSDRIGSMDYYIYNPTEHGFAPDRQYPVIMAFHGANNGGANNERCGALTDWMIFASDEYQKRLGGAFIVFPKANEYTTVQRIQDGDKIKIYKPAGTWMRGFNTIKTSIYSDAIQKLYEHIKQTYNTRKLAVIGSSAGGYLAWRFILEHPESASAAVIVSPAYTPNDMEIEQIGKQKIRLWIIHGLKDKNCPIDIFTGPAEKKLRAQKNIRLSILDTVRFGNRKIVYYEMRPGSDSILRNLRSARI